MEISVERLVELRQRCKTPSNLCTKDHQDLIDYLSHSIPYDVYDCLYDALLPLLEKLEIEEIHSQDTHAIRNVLATLSGYQVLAYV